MKKQKVYLTGIDEQPLICECCWKQINGEQFEVDGVTMCEECYLYIEEDEI